MILWTEAQVLPFIEKLLSSKFLWSCLFLKFYPLRNFGKFNNFGLGIVRSERVTLSYSMVPLTYRRLVEIALYGIRRVE